MTIKQRRDEVLHFLRNEFALKTSVHPDAKDQLRLKYSGLDQFLLDLANNLTQGFLSMDDDEDEHSTGRELEDDLVTVQVAVPAEPGEPIPQPVEDAPTAPIPAETLDEVSARHKAGRGDPPIHVTEKPTRNLRRPTRVPGCTCQSGLSGASCTLDCRAPVWSR